MNSTNKYSETNGHFEKSSGKKIAKKDADLLVLDW